MIDTPIHKVYYDNVPKVFKDKHAEILKKYSLPFIDLKHIELPQNGYFNDGDHVSLIGAELTTRYLNMHHFTSK